MVRKYGSKMPENKKLETLLGNKRERHIGMKKTKRVKTNDVEIIIDLCFSFASP